MSQPCLPIPRNLSKRKRPRSSTEEDASNNDDSTTFDNIANMDAAEYLFRVVQQAKGLPDVFVAEEKGSNNNHSTSQDPHFVPIDGSAASLSYLLSGKTQLVPPPSPHHLPQDSTRWTEQSIANFERLRTYLTTCKEQGIGGKKTKRLAFPGMKDEEGWLAFCLGPNGNGTEQNGGHGHSMMTEDNETSATESTATEEESVPLWRRDIPANGHDPSVRIILQMDQVLLRQVLSHLGQFICNDLDNNNKSQEHHPQHSHALKWMYSLLARFEFPIHRDDASMLYQLLKALTRARSCLVLSPCSSSDAPVPSATEQSSREILAEWNLLIIIVGVFFEQGGGAANLMTCASR